MAFANVFVYTIGGCLEALGKRGECAVQGESKMLAIQSALDKLGVKYNIVKDNEYLHFWDITLIKEEQ